MRRGDVMITSFPYAGEAAAKERPVLIVQADFYNQRIHNVLVAAITTNLARKSDPAHHFIDVSSPDGKRSGLHQDSVVSCLNLAVMLKSDLRRKIGEFSTQTMEQIDSCLKTALGVN